MKMDVYLSMHIKSHFEDQSFLYIDKGYAIFIFYC